jgi:hypothetical protein
MAFIDHALVVMTFNRRAAVICGACPSIISQIGR